MLTKAQEAARSAAIDAGLNPGTLKAFPTGWEQPTAADIRIIMKLANLTGSKVGELTGTDPRSVRRWTSNDRNISYATWAILLAGAGLGNIWEDVAVPAPVPARKNGCTVSDLHKARTLAAQAFKNEVFGSGGFVVVLNGAVSGWVASLDHPEGWEPGCIAVDDVGRVWLAFGGNQYDGAASWEPLQEVEPETRAGDNESRSKLDDLRKTVKFYLATLERRPRAGYVIMPTEGEAFKCSAVKPKPWSQFPGCIAYSIGDGSLYVAVGDHEEFKGMAERWEPLL